MAFDNDGYLPNSNLAVAFNVNEEEIALLQKLGVPNKRTPKPAVVATLQRREAQVKHSFLGQRILNSCRDLSRLTLCYTM